MANCSIVKQQYIDVVESLIKYNPTLYSNFDNAVEFVLKNSLTPEEKKTSIHHFAEIYQGLHNLDNSFYNKGKAEDILGAINLYVNEDSKTYMKYISDLYGIKSVNASQNAIDKEIEKLENENFITPSTLNETLRQVVNYLKANDDGTEDYKKTCADYQEKLSIAIKNKKLPDVTTTHYINAISSAFGTLAITSSYIGMKDRIANTGDVQTVFDAANLKSFLVHLEGGVITEGYLKEGRYYINNGQPIPEEQIEFVSEMTPAMFHSKATGGVYAFASNHSDTGLRITPVDPKVSEGAIFTALNNGMPFTVKAVKLSTIGDDRIARIKEFADNDPQYAPLSNRNHETFENPNQQAYLKNNSDGKVISVSRPKASEQDFILIGEITGTSDRFYLHTIENFTIVGADNSTELVNFNDESHKILIEKMTVKESTDGSFSPTTKADVENLTNAYKEYQDFKKIVNKKLQKDSKALSIDVTKEFKNIYVQKTVKVTKYTDQKTKLSEAIETDEHLFVTEKVITKTPEGQEDIIEDKKLVVIFNKEINTESLSLGVKYTYNRQLGTNQKIAVTEKVNGKDVTSEYDEEDYLRAKYGITDEWLSKRLKDELGEENLSKESGKKGRINTGMFLIAFWKDAVTEEKSIHAIRVIKKLKYTENTFNFVRLIAGINNVIPITGVSQAKIVSFNTSEFKFDNVKLKDTTYIDENGKTQVEKGVRSIYVNFDSVPNKGNLQIAIIASKTEKDFDEIINGHREDFKFQLDKDRLRALNTILANGNPVEKKASFERLLDKIIKETPSLQIYDLTKHEDLLKFYDSIYTLYNSQTVSDDIKQLVVELEKLSDKFTKYMKSAVTDVIKENKDGKYTDFLKVAETRIGDIERLILQPSNVTDGKQSLSIIIQSANAKERLRYNSDLNNTYVVSNNKSKEGGFSLVSGSEITERQKAKENKRLDVKGLHEETKAVEIVPENSEIHTDIPETNNDMSDDIPSDSDATNFLIAHEYTVSDQQDKQEQLSWLSEVLPQAGISMDDMAEVLDLSKLDGTVLGFYQDRVLHFNKHLFTKGIVYHEAFHAVFEHILDNKQRIKLVNDVIGDKRNASKFTKEALNKFAKERDYNNMSMDELAERQASEIMADGFKKYKETKKSPKGFLEHLFNLLDRLINFFTRNNVRTVYNRMDRGYYKTVVMKSGLTNGTKSFELVPGLHIIKKTEAGVQKKVDTLTPKWQGHLVDLITSEVINLDGALGKTFDVKYEEATRKLLDTTLDINNLIDSSNIDTEEAIRKAYGPIFSQFRFLLGGRMKGYDIADINMSGVEQYDNKAYSNKITLSTGEVIDNTDGSYSAEVIKNLVKRKIKDVNVINIDRSDIVNKEDIEDNLDEAKQQEIDANFDNAEEVPEDLGDSDIDKNFAEMNRLESMTIQIRRFLSTIRSDYYDKELNVTIPRVLDGTSIFPSLLKITSDLDPDSIVTSIDVLAKQMKDDGYDETSNDLQAIYNEMHKRTNINKDNNPTTNVQLFNAFIDVLHGVQMDFTMIGLTTPKEMTQQDQENPEYRERELSFRIKDKVAEVDANTKKQDILFGLIETFKNKAFDPKTVVEYAKAVDALKKACNTLSASIEATDLLSNFKAEMTETQRISEKLEELTSEISTNMKIVGLNIPKSLIRLSILAIHNVENKQKFNENTSKDILDFYNTHEGFVKEKQYLEKDFFTSMVYMLNQMFTKGKANYNFTDLIDDSLNQGTNRIKNVSIDRLSTILRNASTYIIKYDPTSMPSVIKNAEGKSIYRFVKYTPLISYAQDFRRKGLLNTLLEDPYAFHSLLPYMKDHKYFGDIINGIDSPSARIGMALLENLRISYMGGVEQSIGDVKREGSTFKNIDKKSLYVTNILLFMGRKTIDKKGQLEEGEEASVQRYLSSFHTIESTQTNFLVTSLYTPFMINTKTALGFKRVKELEHDSKYLPAVEDTKLGRVLYKKRYLKIVEDLESNVKQEYNRIQREWARRAEVRDNYNNGIKNEAVVNYNAVFDNENRKIITDDTDFEEKNKLRAYKFNVLDTFFNDPAHKTVKDELIEMAKTGVSFDEIDKDNLLDLLNKYAHTEYKNHKTNLVNLGVVKYEHYNTGAGRPVEYLTSTLIGDKVKIDDKDMSLSEMYPSIPDLKPGESQHLESLLFDNFFNFWKNKIQFNQLFDGDIAMSVKNAQDLVKRYKKLAAAGSTLKSGLHSVSYINTLIGYHHQDHIEFGPYRTVEDVKKDTSKHLTEEIKTKIINEFGTDKMILTKIFDGQSFSTLNHQIDINDALGRLDEKSKELLIAKHYRKLTEKEVDYLESNKIVCNSKKTVTAERYSYHKLSEALISRDDVSEFIEDTEENRKALDAIYWKIYQARKEKKEWHILYGEENRALYKSFAEEQDEKIKELANEAHSYFRALPARQELHDMLNSMEYFNIDQVMDTEASKNATLMPLDIFTSTAVNHKGTDYHNLGLSKIDILNKHKYLQVETSGIKDKSKVSVQKKLLIAADLRDIKRIAILYAASKGLTVSAADEKAMDSINDILAEYHESLRDSANSRLTYLKEIMRNNGDINISSVFDIIRKSLEEQGAPEYQTELFALKGDGTPKFSPNIALVRKTLEYYFFGQYSTNVTDEKASGFKSFHESSFGYNQVIVDDNDNVIPFDEIKKNPNAYREARQRPLGVSIEIDEETGIKTYFVETIISKPFFENKLHEKFWMENITKMFGVRIPSEDKRSFMAIKVVDFTDSAKQNTVIVPNFIHILAGSDFDIDSLFGQTLSYYKDIQGQYHVYGNYEGYADKKVGEFEEFLQYMGHKSEFSKLISADLKEKMDKGELTLTPDLKAALLDAGFDDTDLHNAFSMEEFDTKYHNLKVEQNKIYNIREDIKQSIQELKEIEDITVDEYLTDVRNELSKAYDEKTETYNQSKEVFNKVKALGEEKYRAYKVIGTAFRYQAIFNVFADYNDSLRKGNTGERKIISLPTTKEAYHARPQFNTYVADKFQNKNLKDSINIMSHEFVYKNLFINQQSSTQYFKDILGQYGIKLSDIASKSNMLTMDAVILAKVTNEMNKMGISITAAMNKFLSLCSQMHLELNQKDVVWNYQRTDKDGNIETVNRNMFGTLNDNDERIIALIGNILGMFADGAKDPIPAALQMNEVNAGITMAMIGIGLDPMMSFGFNFIPEIQSAVKTVQANDYAIAENLSESRKYVNKEISNQIKALIQIEKDSLLKVKADPNQYMNDLIKVHGVLLPGSTAGNIKLNKANIIIDFDKTKRSVENFTDKLMDGTLTLKEIGFSVKSTKETDISLPESAQKIILMQYYSEQASQTWDIRKASSITSLFKRINPNFVVFDRTLNNIKALKDTGLIFTPESAKRLFADDQVWSVLDEMGLDLHEQSTKLFLERMSFFSPIRTAFETVFADKSQIATTLTSFIGIRKLLLEKPILVGSPERQANIMKDYQNKKEVFSPGYWYTHELGNELKQLLQKYPDNAFLKMLRLETDTTDRVRVEGENSQAFRYLKMIGAKPKGDKLKNVYESVDYLYNHSGEADTRLFIKKLMYHELARGGMGFTKGGFFQYLPQSILQSTSDNIENFVDILKKSLTIDNIKDREKNLYKDLAQFMEISSTDTAAMKDFFNEMFFQLAYAAGTQENKSLLKGSYDIKFGTGYDRYFETYDEQYESGIMKTLHDVAPQNRRDVGTKLVSNVVPSAKNIDKGFFLGTLSGEFVVNLKDQKVPGVGQDTMDYIARAFRAQKDVATGLYKFQPILTAGQKIFMLQGVDNEISNATFGEVMINSIIGKSTYTATGTSAKYVELPVKFKMKNLSPIAFDEAATHKYEQLMSRNIAVTSSEKAIKSNYRLFEKHNNFSVNPIQSKDEKATSKASIATQYIGFGTDIKGSSTEHYRLEAGPFANTGKYGPKDVIFVSVSGKRGSQEIATREQDKTIKETIKALEAGATIIVDNKDYIFNPANSYNTGEMRLYKNLEAKGYKYSEAMVDNKVLGVWNKKLQLEIDTDANNAELNDFVNVSVPGFELTADDTSNIEVDSKGNTITVIGKQPGGFQDSVENLLKQIQQNTDLSTNDFKC